MRTTLLLTGFLSTATFAFVAGCGDSGDTSGSGGESSTTGATTTTSSGMGGDATTTTTTTTTTTGAGGSGGAPDCSTGTPPTDHVVISEIVSQPVASEGLELYNPTNAAVDLTDYYLSDNSQYYELAAGLPWNPTTTNVGTDFLAQFPAGTMIAAGGVLTVGFDGAGYFADHGVCPNFFMATAPVACGGGNVPNMVPTESGSIDDANVTLSDAREMLMLFKWNGTVGCPVQDVDYVTWGSTVDPGSRADKTGVPGYSADTAPASQDGAVAPGPLASIERCALNSGETTTGGNGITGHDETSEDCGTSFVLLATPTLGVKNTCLP